MQDPNTCSAYFTNMLQMLFDGQPKLVKECLTVYWLSGMDLICGNFVLKNHCLIVHLPDQYKLKRSKSLNLNLENHLQHLRKSNILEQTSQMLLVATVALLASWISKNVQCQIHTYFFWYLARYFIQSCKGKKKTLNCL